MSAYFSVSHWGKIPTIIQHVEWMLYRWPQWEKSPMDHPCESQERQNGRAPPHSALLRYSIPRKQLEFKPWRGTNSRGAAQPMSALLLLTAALHTNLLNTVNWTDDTGQRHCRCGKHWHQKQNKTLSRLAHAQQLKKNDFLMPVWVTKALRARIPATALLTLVKRRLASAFFGPGQWQHCLPHTHHNAEPAQRRPCQHHRTRYLRRRPRRRAHSATPQHARNAQRRLTATPRNAAQRSTPHYLLPGGWRETSPQPTTLLGLAVPPPDPAALGRPRSASAASRCHHLAAAAGRSLPARSPGARFPSRWKGLLNRAPRRRTSGPREAWAIERRVRWLQRVTRYRTFPH